MITILISFNTSREGDFTTSLSSLFQSLNTLSAKKYFLKSWLDWVFQMLDRRIYVWSMTYDFLVEQIWSSTS